MTSTLYELALQRKEHRLSEHKKRHSQQREAAYKDMLDAAPAVEQKPTLVAWILYDATTDKKYIKMDPADGSLAIFDSEEAAMSAKRLNSGTDYERCEYYSAPKPSPEVAKLVEALEGFLAIASDSSGIAGYHLNGEIAHWGEFEEVAMAEEALAIYHKRGDL